MIKTTYLFFIFFSTITFVQNKNIIEILNQKLEDARTLTNSDAKTAIITYNQLYDESKAINYEEGMLRSKENLVNLYFNSGQYEEVVKTSNEVEALALKIKNYSTLAKIYRQVAASYSMLRLNDEALKVLDKAKMYADKIKDPATRYYNTALIYDSYSVCVGLVNQDVEQFIYYVEKSLEELYKISDQSTKETIDSKYDLIGFQNFRLADVYYTPLKQVNKTKQYYIQALEIYENPKYTISPNNKVILYSSLSDFYFTQNDFENAIIYGEKALIFSRLFDQPETRKEIYDVLLKSYLETGQREKSKHFAELYTQLNDSLIKNERQEVNTSVNKIVAEKENISTKQINQIISLTLFLLTVSGLLEHFLWQKKEKKHKEKYKQLIYRLENKKLEQQEQLGITPETNSIIGNISQSTEDKIIKKLVLFEKSKKFLKKDVTVSYLSNELDTNPKYLSQIIQKHKEQNFSGYINKLRINYITTKLYNDFLYREYKISYLATECGSASTQVFVIAFKKENGIPPSQFINELKKDSLAI